MVALHWEKYFQRIREKYNKIYKKELPVITPHVARHTFCSNMAKSGVNPKKLQYIMGHANVSITLDVYTHLDFSQIQKKMEAVQKNTKSDKIRPPLGILPLRRSYFFHKRYRKGTK